MAKRRDHRNLSQDPKPGYCSLCDDQCGPFVHEQRPTGFGGILQSWPFCASCWRESQAMSQDIGGYLKLLYEIFQRDPRTFRTEVAPIGEIRADDTRQNDRVCAAGVGPKVGGGAKIMLE